VPHPDFALARRIYYFTTRFYYYMIYMAIVAVELLLAFLNPFFAVYSGFLARIISYVTSALSLISLVAAPFVLYSIWQTWNHLSKWRRSFLRFTLISNIESVPFEAGNPQERLLDAIITVNPEYKHVLSHSRFDPEDHRDEYSGERQPETIVKDLFKNVTITHRGKSATFDVLIGYKPKARSNPINSFTRPLSKLGGMANLFHMLSEIGTSAGRIVKGKPSIEEYRRFAEDLKLLASFTNSRIIRAFLVSTELPDPQIVEYAKDKRNWPRYELVRIPIDLVLQEDVSYHVVLAN